MRVDPVMQRPELVLGRLQRESSAELCLPTRTLEKDNQKEASDTKAGSGAKANTSTAPGATGKTVVPGSNSTVTGDKSATEEQKKVAVRGKQ
jgi:hypothetical protein